MWRIWLIGSLLNAMRDALERVGHTSLSKDIRISPRASINNTKALGVPSFAAANHATPYNQHLPPASAGGSRNTHGCDRPSTQIFTTQYLVRSIRPVRRREGANPALLVDSGSAATHPPNGAFGLRGDESAHTWLTPHTRPVCFKPQITIRGIGPVGSSLGTDATCNAAACYTARLATWGAAEGPGRSAEPCE